MGRREEREEGRGGERGRAPAGRTMVYRLLQTRSDCRRARLYSGCASSDMGLVFDYYEYDFSPSKTFCVSMLDYCTYCLARRFLHYSDHATDRHLFPPYHSLPHLHIHQPNPMSSPPPANFHKTELHRALTEQTTSISHFHLIDPDPDSARTSCDAEVRTLEGKTVCITLSSRGYSVSPVQNRSGWTQWTEHPAGEV